jgi:DNA repair ATPase RecN
MENFKTIENLLTQLSDWVVKQRAGELDIESIEKATDTARELYENWVHLKFLKLNSEDNPNSVEETIKETFSVSKNTVKKEKDIVENNYEDLKNLEAEIGEVSENQTTLIEIIEEIQEDLNINERIAKGQTRETLADKHAKNPIEDLEKSIGINQKFSFIKHLFNNDKDAYTEAMVKLNSYASYLEADDFINNQLKNKYDWDKETVHIVKFIDLVERRYLPHRK